ncbi:hypothetical protein NDU88_005448 [Pleurodeles waltl]|uniref:Uncharacterized protein n=1 Tax=Pleurodeles waltl TaxID=8319 RepID=A0AAV7TCB6_PLEWA|nr:hypothetical protein NDU88_005448 [Pleurodeles waltl]
MEDSETPWSLLHPSEDPPVRCEKFEANLFAQGRCQHCFRGQRYHQLGPGAQPPEQVVDSVLIEHSYYDVVFTPETRDPSSPLCILAPECELFIGYGNEQEERKRYVELTLNRFVAVGTGRSREKLKPCYC